MATFAFSDNVYSVKSSLTGRSALFKMKLNED